MPVVALRSLRVTADFDSSAYTRGMAAKVAADQAGAASSKAVGAALAQTDAAMDAATGRAAGLSRSLIDGYGSAARFESTIRSIGRAVDSGMGLERAAVLVEAANRKFGMTADAAALSRQGYVSLAPVVAEVNARYAAQAQVADQAAAALRRLGEAEIASSRMIGGMSSVGGPRVADLAANQRLIAGMSGEMDRFGKSTGQANYLTKQLSFQLYDIAQGIPLAFESPIYGLQNLAVQTGQVSQLYAGQGGLKQAFADTTATARSLGVGLVAGLASPLGQVAVVAGVVAVAIGAMFLRERSQAQAAEDALKRHIELIGRIKDAYGEAKGAVEAYGTESLKLLLAIEQEQQKTIKEQLNRDALRSSDPGGRYGALSAAAGEITPQTFAAIKELRKEAIAGAADWRRYGEALTAALNEPGISNGQQTIIRGLLDEAAAHARIQAELLKTKKALVELTEADDQRQSFRRERTQGAGDVGRASDAYRTSVEAATASYEAQLLSIRAISHEEEIAAARAQARANALQDGNITAQETLEIERAGNLVAARFASERERFQTDIAFDRSQLSRTAKEREVADAMRQLWGEDYPRYMHSATAESVRFNVELEKTIGRLDAIRGATQQTISTLLEGLEEKDFGGAVESALKSIRSRLNDAVAGTVTDALAGEQGQLGGGAFGGFLTKLVGGTAGARGATPLSPLFVSVVGGAMPGGVGGIIGDIFNGRGAASTVPGPTGSGQSAILNLIARAEGTAGRGDYNTTLAYGALTGGPQNLTGMSLDQIDALQTQMLQNPANRWNSSAVGRYQITQRTLRGLRGDMGLSGSDLYDPAMQDRLAGGLLDRRGGDIGGLRNEWAGLQRVDSSEIQNALAQSSKDISAASTKFSGDFSGSLTNLSGGMQRTVGSFAPAFGGSLEDLLKSFNASGSSGNFGGWLNSVFGGGFYSGPPLPGAGLFSRGGSSGGRRGAMIGPSVPASGAAPQWSVHVHSDGAPYKVKQTSDGRGGGRLDITRDEMVAAGMRSAKGSQAMRGTYGSAQRLERT